MSFYQAVVHADEVVVGSDLLYVTFMGIGLVFFGLICIVFICKLMSMCIKKSPVVEQKPENQAVPVEHTAQSVTDKREFTAAIAAAIAQASGKEMSAIRISSIKKL